MAWLSLVSLLVSDAQALLTRVANDATPTVLLMPGTNSRGWPGGQGDSPEITLDRCPVQCNFVHGQENLTAADAVVWDFCNVQAKWIPTGDVVKPQHQKWIFSWEHESENCGNCQANQWDTVGPKIDWTMTYNSRSDFWLPYATMVKREDSARTHEINHATGKSNTLLWLVGNLGSVHRLQVFKQLRHHLSGKSVHMLGRSGSDGPWPCGAGHGEKDSTNCSDTHFATYKFYFAAENARCQDYITEKFFKGLLHGMVPVVLGGLSRSDYERVAVSSSFIHIDDFPSVAALADRLKFLDSNDAEYNKYFEWRSTHEISMTSARNDAWCNLCQNLQTRRGSLRTAARPTHRFLMTNATVSQDLTKWWTQGTCM